MCSFDIFEAGPDYVAETVLVITPYVESSFFEELVSRATPERLVVVIDDGCRREDLTTIQDAVAKASPKRRNTKLVTVLGSAPGLVHLKLYYIVWRSKLSGYHSRWLIFGSANATRQGFSGTSNSELIAHCRLVGNRHGDVIQWCEAVIDAANRGQEDTIEEVADVALDQGGVLLRLPAITVGRERSHLSNFDLWVQRGRLLSIYRPEPAFLKVPIQLGQRFEPVEQARIIAGSGFAIPMTNRLIYPYVGQGVDDDDDDAAEDGIEAGNRNWRSQLFVWTNLGEWCSEACFDARGNEFRRRGYEIREQRLQRLKLLNDPNVREDGRTAFLTALDTLWARFGDEAPLFLRGNGGIDRAFYEASYDRRVDCDLELAADSEFRNRFVSGFAITEVPQFRNDVKGWRSFLNSMVEQLCLEDIRPGSQSRLLRAVRAAAERMDQRPLDSAEALLGFLRENWRDDIANEDLDDGMMQLIASYHLPE